MLEGTESPPPQFDNVKDPFTTTDRNRPDYQDYFKNDRRNTNYENIDTTTTTFKALESLDKREDKGADSGKTHDTIVNESESEKVRVDNTQKVQTEAEAEHFEISTRPPVDTNSQTEHVVIQTFKTSMDDSTTLTTEHNEIITNNKMTTAVHGTSIKEISNLEDPTKSTTNMAVTSENTFDGKGTDLTNEISNDLGVASTEVTNNKNLNPNKTVDNEVTGTSKPDDIINNSKKPGDNIIRVVPGNELNANKESTENSVSDLSLTTTDNPNVSSGESNEVRKPNATEPSRSDIGITKPSEKDTNEIGSHSIEILNQKIETTTVDSNFNDTCNAGTCSASAASNGGEQNKEPVITEEKTTPSPKTTAEVDTQKNIMHNEEIETKGTNDKDKNTAIVTMSTVSNKDELADPITTVSTTLQSKLGPTTELTTLGNKSYNKTKGKKNGAFSISGCILLIANVYFLCIAL